MSHGTQWVMAHNESWHTMSHGTQWVMAHNESWHTWQVSRSQGTYEWVLIWICPGQGTYEWVSHMSQGTYEWVLHMSEGAYEWVLSHIWIRPVAHTNESRHTSMSRGIHEWVMAHMDKSAESAASSKQAVAHIDESWPMWMSYGRYECDIAIINT